MVGIPGSGKTTLARIAFPRHAIISLDRIRKFGPARRRALLERYGGVSGGGEPGRGPCRQQRLSKARRMEHVMIGDALGAGRNVVVDDTNVTAEIRRRHVCHARRYGATVNAVFFVNVLRAYGRNERRAGALKRTVLDGFLRELEPPDEGEGFAFIQRMY